MWRSTTKGTWNNATTVVAALAASAAAVFSGIQAWIARDAEIRQLRPYVFLNPDQPFFKIQLSSSGEVSGYVRLKTFGSTPAYNLSLRTVVEGEAWPLSRTANFASGVNDSRDDASPGGTLSFPVSSHLAPGTVDEIRHRQKRLLVAGQINYIDAFDREHWTHFCLGFLAAPDLSQEGPIVFQGAEHCHVLNDADRN